VFDRLVANASPLIFLSRIDGLGWLPDLGTGTVEVPRAVVREIEAGADGGEVIDAIGQHSRFVVIEDAAPAPVIAAWDLGAGETQVLEHCRAIPAASALLDDRLARECARSLGVPVIGTLGVVLAARRRAWIPAARPVVERLLEHGLYVTADLVAAALREVGE
jgi:predicted nucleic acid-binding protein